MLNWQPSENGGEAATICSIEGFDILANKTERPIEYQMHVWAGPIDTEDNGTQYLAALFSVSEIGRRLVCAFGTRDTLELAKTAAENGLEDVAYKILDGTAEIWEDAMDKAKRKEKERGRGN